MYLNYHEGKTKALILLFLVLSLTGAGFWFLGGGVDQKTISNEVTLTRVSMKGEKTTNAYISLPYTRDGEKYQFVNAAVDFNKDGKVAPYQMGDLSQEEWVVQNMPARVLAQEGNSFDFQLSDLSVEEGKDFPVTVVLTANKLNAWDGGKIRGSAIRSLLLSAIATDEMSERMEPDPTGKGSVGAPGEIPNQPPTGTQNDSGSTGEAKEKTLETLAKEFDVFHSDVPDVTQGKNECVPTSTANSLRWLSEKYNFKDKLPLSNTELLGELKDDMKWGVGHGVFVRTDFLTGKQAFTARHGIPIETHRVGGEFDINIVPKIAQELKKGQDVEIDLEYGKYKADGSYERKGGHMVTVVGARGTGDAQYLDIHDPASPGTSKLDIYKIDGTRVANYRYQGSYVTYIRFAFAESPVETPVVVPPITSTPPTGKVNVMSEYETFVNDAGNSEIAVYVTPVDTGGKNIDKVVLHLDNINETHYADNLNINLAGWRGETNAVGDWSCNLSGKTYTCLGKTPLAINRKSVFYFYYNVLINTLPTSLWVYLYSGDQELAATQAGRKQ